MPSERCAVVAVLVCSLILVAPLLAQDAPATSPTTDTSAPAIAESHEQECGTEEAMLRAARVEAWATAIAAFFTAVTVGLSWRAAVAAARSAAATERQARFGEREELLHLRQRAAFATDVGLTKSATDVDAITKAATELAEVTRRSGLWPSVRRALEALWTHAEEMRKAATDAPPDESADAGAMRVAKARELLTAVQTAFDAALL